jgi:hypothetical protein
MLAISLRRPVAARFSVNNLAARIGPTVCELDGPMPILNMSKALIIIGLSFIALLE